MTKEDLADHLRANGYINEDPDEIAEAFFAKGFEAAVAVIESYDDAEHDYTGELRMVLTKWHDAVSRETKTPGG